MQAMRVRRLSASDSDCRLYLNGKRVSRVTWETAHYGKRLDTFQSRIVTGKDGREIVREYHCIRTMKDRA